MPDNKTTKKSLITRISEGISSLIRFVTYDIWRVADNEMSGLRRSYIYVAKTVWPCAASEARICRHAPQH